MNSIQKLLPAAVAALTLALAAALPARAAPVTECATIGICYCINSDFKPIIDDQVSKLRAMIAAERAKGKAIGYLSVPLSTGGGGVFSVNREVAERTGRRVEARMGASHVWMLVPGMKEADIPNAGSARAGGGEYMVMWTRILEGPSGFGDDFDFFYFTGPSDFAAYFGLTGSGDMDRIAAFYADRIKTDAELQRAVEQGRVSPTTFRNYYGLRASTTVSLGAHDEWNIAGKINSRRRENSKFGSNNQLPVFFDGRPVSGAEAESPVSNGYAGACKP